MASGDVPLDGVAFPHNWVDYNQWGYIFSRVTRMGSHIFWISAIRKFWQTRI